MVSKIIKALYTAHYYKHVHLDCECSYVTTLPVDLIVILYHQNEG